MGGTIAVPTYRRLTWSFTGAGSRGRHSVEKLRGARQLAGRCLNGPTLPRRTAALKWSTGSWR